MLKRREIILVTALALASFSGTTTAHAAAWHSETPKDIRGHWIFKNKMIYGYYYVRAHQICFQNNQGIPYLETQVKYKNLGHGKYKLRYMFRYLRSTFEQNIQYGYIVKRHGQLNVSGGEDPHSTRYYYHYRYHRGSYTSLNRRGVRMTRPFSKS